MTLTREVRLHITRKMRRLRRVFTNEERCAADWGPAVIVYVRLQRILQRAMLVPSCKFPDELEAS